MSKLFQEKYKENVGLVVEVVFFWIYGAFVLGIIVFINSPEYLGAGWNSAMWLMLPGIICTAGLAIYLSCYLVQLGAKKIYKNLDKNDQEICDAAARILKNLPEVLFSLLGAAVLIFGMAMIATTFLGLAIAFPLAAIIVLLFLILIKVKR